MDLLFMDNALSHPGEDLRVKEIYVFATQGCMHSLTYGLKSLEDEAKDDLPLNDLAIKLHYVHINSDCER